MPSAWLYVRRPYPYAHPRRTPVLLVLFAGVKAPVFAQQRRPSPAKMEPPPPNLTKELLKHHLDGPCRITP